MYVDADQLRETMIPPPRCNMVANRAGLPGTSNHPGVHGIGLAPEEADGRMAYCLNCGWTSSEGVTSFTDVQRQIRYHLYKSQRDWVAFMCAQVDLYLEEWPVHPSVEIYGRIAEAIYDVYRGQGETRGQVIRRAVIGDFEAYDIRDRELFDLLDCDEDDWWEHLSPEDEAAEQARYEAHERSLGAEVLS